ncbi:MAG TPA: patatin-like phospholipase family protein [Mycobacteriales bacterium]|nr:patatin-like phospholipase family protein [Mycobacteriales bacterium]
MTRRGLVLGAGGVLGFSWMVGALAALEQIEGFDVREMEVCVGTSAGSVSAAMLGCGISVEQMLRHQRGERPAPDDPPIAFDYNADSGGALPPRPALRFGSPKLAWQVARQPRRFPPLAAMSAALPRGRGTLEPVTRVVAGLAGAQPWPERPRAWVVAMDYDSGRRVAFGRNGAPAASLAQAVTASCSIPGWYAPTVINGRRYVDGGICSATSADLLAGFGLDEVYVLAPMASFTMDRPRSATARLERRFRQATTKRMQREAAKLRVGGTEVIMLGPGPEDLAAIGANLMNPRRRARVLETSLRTSTAALRRDNTATGLR